MRLLDNIQLRHPELQYVKRGITHPGQAHVDDFLFASLASCLCPEIKTWERIEPAQYHLDDPCIIIGDVGLYHQPDLLNFDHHQGMKEDCATSLFCKYLGIHEAMILAFQWYLTVIEMDAKGPYATCTNLGISPDLLRKLGSPITGYFLRKFEIGTLPIEYLRNFGEYILDIASRIEARMKHLTASVGTVVARNLRIIYYTDILDTDPNFGIEDWKNSHYPDAAIFVSPDTRDNSENKGWSLYRFNDHPRVDFRRLPKGSARFIHDNGFIAKIPNCSIEQAITIATMAIE